MLLKCCMRWQGFDVPGGLGVSPVLTVQTLMVNITTFKMISSVICLFMENPAFCGSEFSCPITLFVLCLSDPSIDRYQLHWINALYVVCCSKSCLSCCKMVIMLLLWGFIKSVVWFLGTSYQKWVYVWHASDDKWVQLKFSAHLLV